MSRVTEIASIVAAFAAASAVCGGYAPEALVEIVGAVIAAPEPWPPEVAPSPFGAMELRVLLVGWVDEANARADARHKEEGGFGPGAMPLEVILHGAITRLRWDAGGRASVEAALWVGETGGVSGSARITSTATDDSGEARARAAEEAWPGGTRGGHIVHYPATTAVWRTAGQSSDPTRWAYPYGDRKVSP